MRREKRKNLRLITIEFRQTNKVKHPKHTHIYTYTYTYTHIYIYANVTFRLDRARLAPASHMTAHAQRQQSIDARRRDRLMKDKTKRRRKTFGSG